MTKSENMPTIDNPSDTDLAWAAGIIDGEGHVGVNRRKDFSKKYIRVHHAIMSVSSTTPAMLSKMRALFGGGIYEKKRRLGTRPCWQWSISSKRVVRAIGMIRKYMIVKGDIADLVLEMVGTLHHGRARFQTVPIETIVNRDQIAMRIMRINSNGGRPLKPLTLEQFEEALN